MSSNFVNEIADVRRRLWRRRGLVATCWALAAVVAAALVLVALDRALGIHDALGRVLWTVGFAVGCAMIFRKWSKAVWGRPITLQEVAQLAERQQPQLRDLVTSGLEFSQQSETDPWVGSAALRRAIVLRAATAVEDVDWQRIVSRRPLRQALWAMAGVLLVTGGLVWWAPHALGTGVARLLNPLSDVQWPRDHNLQFVDPPQKLAVGDDLQLLLRDTHGSLPKTVTMHYRVWRNGRWREESRPLAAAGETVSIRRPSLQESLEYRATGGDHRTMPWRQLAVVAPPRVTELQITSHPPAYTGLPSTTLARRAQVLAGCRLELRGAVDQPLKKVLLCNEEGWKLPVALAAEGRQFELPKNSWIARQGGAFYLQFTTLTGLTTRTDRLVTLEVIPDTPPEVRFEQPLSDLTVTPAAELPLVVTAQDDLAVQNVELVYRRTDRSEEGNLSLPLWRGPDRVESSDALRLRRVEFLWQLAPLELKPGSVVELHARASDYQPAPGQTTYPLRISIVTPSDMLGRIGQRETRLLNEIERLLRLQRALRSTTAEWNDPLDWSDERWANQGHVALFRQRQIAARLTENPDSAVQQLVAISAAIARNRLERPETTQRLHDLQFALQDLADRPLPAIDQLLGKLIRHSETKTDTPRRRPVVAQIAEHQDEVIAVLQRALDRLTLGEQLGLFERDLRQLHSEQVELMEQCHDLMIGILQAEKSLPEETTGNAASKQRQLARRLAEWRQRMAHAIERLAAESPALASRVDETVTLARELGVQAAMIQAADHVAASRLGRAAPLQRQATDALQELLDRLTGRDAAAAIARLEMARLDALLDGLVGRQQALLEEIVRLDHLRQTAGRLTTAQQQSVVQLADVQTMLQEETIQQADKLHALPVFVHALRMAAAGMQQVSDPLRQQATGKSTQQAARKVLEQLHFLADVVKQERRNLAEDASQGSGGGQPGDSTQVQGIQLVLGQLKLLKSLQLALQEETRALESRIDQGQAAEKLLAEARRLAERQQQLARVAEELQPKPVEAPVENLFPNLEEELKRP
ncbi:MAG: hypothetical protein MI725_06905 [Pirellulales bacterium]|nr:hypothetical protein [Pirellulales bacterium]